MRSPSLDEAEMKAALRLAAKAARKAKQGQQRAREQQQQLLLQLGMVLSVLFLWERKI